MFNIQHGNSYIAQITISSILISTSSIYIFFAFPPLPSSIPLPIKIYLYLPGNICGLEQSKTNDGLSVFAMPFENCPSVQILLSFIPLSILCLLLQLVIYTARKLYKIHEIQANRIKSKWYFSQLLKRIEFCDPELQKLILSQQSNTDGPHEVFCATSNLTCETFCIILKIYCDFEPYAI